MYLSEHNLMDYAVLKEKASSATARYDALAARIKAAENRMSEIAELRTQIINYAKTREVYEAYRKAGYSKSSWPSMRETSCPQGCQSSL